MEICETTITATSSDHAELLALHEARRKRVWLRSLIQHIQENCGLSSKDDNINIQQIRPCANIPDIFTKSLTSRIFEQMIQNIDRRHLKDVCMVEGEK